MTARAPAGLARRGRHLWRQVTAEFTFDPLELVLLEELARTLDIVDALGVRIAADPGATGLLVEQRLQRDLASKLSRQLRLPSENATPETAGASRLGSRGNAVRWGYARPEVVKGA